MAHHGPGVDAGDPDDALADEFVFQRAGGAPVGRARRRVAHRVTGDPDPLPSAFGVLAVPAGVADLRRGGHHDLTVIAGIGQRLLITGHAGGKHGLPERLSGRAERPAGEHPAVFEDQYGFAQTGSSSHSWYSSRLSARNPTSISVPDGSRQRIASIPMPATTLPATPRSMRMAAIDSVGIQIG
ncbi:Uncharacterised protein [Mycobacterium tuberculosis]|uniref:Uncharacterized protein n=1 Tax=Mycobacterium tuberculosis TaxID=1773 RepID=A0A654TK41_MYCTX|nr:Uncharacterised protein [Mycobacterium tuberculosis]COX28705.1 Uncharacterised protein [Mycobacterium tuberculosis]